MVRNSPVHNAAAHFAGAEGVLGALQAALHAACTGSAGRPNGTGIIASAASEFGQHCLGAMLDLAEALDNWCCCPSSPLYNRQCRDALRSLQHADQVFQEALRVLTDEHVNSCR